MRYFVLSVVGVGILAILGLIAYEMNSIQESAIRQAIVPEARKLSVQTPAFPPEGTIAKQDTCDGADISPRLLINNVPGSAVSLALLMEDTSVSGAPLVHWIMWNIPASTTSILEGQIPPGATEGTTSFQTVGYYGPCPSLGTQHQYVLYLYALNTQLTLPRESGKDALLRVMLGHQVGEASVTGFYERQ